MFPIKWSDFFRKKDGNLVFMDEMGGSNINWMTQSEWNELTLDEKKAAGFTAIGEEGSPQGTYYDYSNLVPWKYNSDYSNIIDIFYNGGYNFHGFFSNTVGDRVTSQDRGGTRTSGSKVFICNGLGSTNYGYFMMFGKTQEDLHCSNTSYYGIKKVADYNLYVGSNMEGAWNSNVNVELLHNSVSQNLKDYFAAENYTMLGVNLVSNEIVIPETYSQIIEAIDDFISSV